MASIFFTNFIHQIIINVFSIICFSFTTTLTAIEWYYRVTGKVNPQNLAILVTGK